MQVVLYERAVKMRFWALFVLFLALCCTKGGRECVQRSYRAAASDKRQREPISPLFFFEPALSLNPTGTQLDRERIFQPSKESDTHCDCKLIVEEERNEIVE